MRSQKEKADNQVTDNSKVQAKDNSKVLAPTSREKKVAPFYKKIENTNLAVDAFCYGDLANVKYYLLSHFHSDHYQGEQCQ